MLKSVNYSSIKNKFFDYADLLVLVILGILICQTWFKQEYIIAGADYFPFVFPSDSLERSYYTWDHYEIGLGSSQYNIAHSLVLGIFSLFSSLGFSLAFSQNIYFTMLFVFPAVSMYLLARVVLKNSNWIAWFAAGFFYMLNVFVMTSFWSFVGMWAYTLIPLLLAILIKAFQSISKRGNVKIYAVLFAIVSIGTSYLSLNPAVLVIVPMILGTCSVFHLILCCKSTEERKGVIKFLILCVILSLLVNLWWIIPFYTAVFETKTVIIAETNIATWSWTMARNQLLNVFRLNTLWAFIPEYFEYAPVYSTNPILIFSTLAPILLVATGLLFRDFRKNRFLIYSFAVITPLFFIVKGVQPPFGWVYEWIYLNVPYFWLFREPAGKFFYVLMPLCAVLIGFSVSKLCAKLRDSLSSVRKTIRITGLSYSPLVLSVILFSVACYPMLSSEMVPKDRDTLPSMQLQIPDYWYDAADYVNNQPEDFRLLVLPKDEFYQVGYCWGYYGTDSPPRYFFEKPAIVLINTGGYLTNELSLQFIEALYSGLYTETDFPLADALALANIKYVVERNDVDWTRFGTTDLGSPEKIKNLLENKECITLETSIGYLDFYVNEKNSEVITVHPSARYVEGTVSDLFYLRANASTTLFLLNGTNYGRESDAIEESMESYNAPDIAITRHNPTHYTVQVQNATGPYWFSFAESYDEDWALFVNDSKVEKHFVGNGYANAWKIEAEGNYSVSIVYEPQQKAELAYIISIAAFASCIVISLVLVYLRLRKGIPSKPDVTINGGLANSESS